MDAGGCELSLAPTGGSVRLDYFGPASDAIVKSHDGLRSVCGCGALFAVVAGSLRGATERGGRGSVDPKRNSFASVSGWIVPWQH